MFHHYENIKVKSSYFKALHSLATAHFVVFVDSEGAGGEVAAEEEESPTDE